MKRSEFLRQLMFLVILDKVFAIATPAFVAVVMLAGAAVFLL